MGRPRDVVCRLGKCSECHLKLVTIEVGTEHDDYLQHLFRGGTPSIALCDFIFQTLSIIDFISPTIKTITKIYMFQVFQRALRNPEYITNFITKHGVKNLPPEL